MAWFDAKFFGAAFVTLFVIMDPPGIVPLFLALAGKRTPAEIRRLAIQATLTAFLVIVSFTVFGERVLEYLGISLPALQGAGGILLLLVSLELLTGRDSTPTEVDDVNVALVPLGTPLLAGPGAIVAAILFARQADSAAQYVSLGAAIVAVHVLLLLAMWFSAIIGRVLRPSGISILSRIAGLLLAAIAVQLIANAIAGFVHELG